MELFESASPKWLLPSGQMILLSKTSQSQKESWILLLLLMVQKSGVHQLIDSVPIIYKVLCILRWLFGISSIQGIIDLLPPSLLGLSFLCRFSVSPLDNLVRTLRGAWVSLYPKSLQHCWYVAWQPAHPMPCNISEVQHVSPEKISPFGKKKLPVQKHHLQVSWATLGHVTLRFGASKKIAYQAEAIWWYFGNVWMDSSKNWPCT